MAANAGAVAVSAYVALFLVTTQISIVREASPFGDDPWDVVVSYGAIFLAVIIASTWVRSVSHRGSRLAVATATRIRIGVAMALVTIGVTLVSDITALLVVTTPDPRAIGDGRFPLIVGLVVVSAVTTIVATILLVKATATAAKAAGSAALEITTEPDVLDDLLGLARDGSAAVPPIRPAVDRLIATVDRFLASSPASPRRHRLGFGIIAAVPAGVAYDAWHAAIEGPWGSSFAAVLFGVLIASGVLAVYLVTVGPLRLIRPAGRG